MLIDPHKDSEEILRIIGIDPGSTTMGVGLIEVNLKDQLIIGMAAKTLNAKKLRLSELDEKVHSARYSRIYALGDALYDLFAEVKPSIVACESPFMSRRQPTAYGSLMETVYAVRTALRNYDSTIPLDLVDPPTAKIAVGAKGNAGKEEVLAGLVKVCEKEGALFDEEKSGMAIKEIDEHSSDGLAIAYWRYKIFKEKLM